MGFIATCTFFVTKEPLQAEAATSWSASYYNNTTLSGTPVLKQTEKALHFDWGYDSPSSKVNKDNFSAKYEADMTFDETATYRISGVADDRVRVYVDGKLVVDKWTNNVHQLNELVSITKGTHKIKVEYVEVASAAKLWVDFTKSTNWSAQYYPNKTVSLPIKGSEDLGAKIKKDWGYGSPNAALPVDAFSATFRKNITLSAAADYRIIGRADDGIRVYVDNKLVYNNFKPSMDNLNMTIPLTAGTHEVRVDYLEAGGAAYITADLVPAGQWNAVYFPNNNMTGTPKLTERLNTDAYLNKVWGYGSPGAGIGVDNFSGFFSKQYNITEAGNYRLVGKVDDGVRIYVDGKAVVNSWDTFQDNLNYTLPLTKGKHQVTVQYREKTGAAHVQMNLVKANAWYEQYFNNTTWGLSSVYTTVGSTSNKLSHNWGTGSPSASVNKDNFTGIMDKQVEITEAKDYRIIGNVDDAAAIFVDGKQVLNQTARGEFYPVVSLTKGTHDIRIKFKEGGGAAYMNFDLIDANSWYAKYYSNETVSGFPYAYDEVIGTTLAKNWGTGSPNSSVPSDHFSARIHRQINAPESFHYRFYGNVKDEAIIYMDGKNMGTVSGQYNQVIWVPKGKHAITIVYKHKTGAASINMNIEKLDKWFARYYKNTTLTGDYVAKLYDTQTAFYQNWAYGSPDPAIPTDNFSAVIEKQYYAPKAQNYNIVGRADDGMRVTIDGRVVFDNRNQTYVREENYVVALTAGWHNVKVEYVERTGAASVDFNILPSNTWVARYYPTNNFSGRPVYKTMSNINDNWGAGSPDPSIPSDNFTARYEATLNMAKDGNYEMTGRADDRIRVKVDGQVVYEQWTAGLNNYKETIPLTKGNHKFIVEYMEDTGSAALSFNINYVTGIEQNYTTMPYNYTLASALAKQMAGSPPPQTSVKPPNNYVRSNFVTLNTGGATGKTNAATSVRDAANPNAFLVGPLAKDVTITITGTVTGTDGAKWYKFNYTRAWVNAYQKDVQFYMNPNNFTKGSKEYLQFLVLSKAAGINVAEVNSKVLVNKGILTGQGASFATAATTYKVNEIYLMSHALLETGNGSSQLANGVLVSNVDGKPVTPKTVYNMYGIGAVDSNPLKGGSEYAYKQGWDTPEKAIIGGAQFVAQNYVSKGQDTLYKMRWNPANPGVHQYATDIKWATSQTTSMYNIYSLLTSYIQNFEVPKYQ
ncbi:PA14 domain-containing protein [Listeria booriae]|uniref:PA14 domain-containing protein n=1 Tax=Listeria booriae TaxID=1552123 RepID=UPI001626476F|nr:PA14 domain-containing protein [Listeria booriae]